MTNAIGLSLVNMAIVVVAFEAHSTFYLHESGIKVVIGKGSAVAVLVVVDPFKSIKLLAASRGGFFIAGAMMTDLTGCGGGECSSLDAAVEHLMIGL